MTRILLCYTMKNYGKLLDEIFNVKLIERAMQLKAMVDCQIMVIYPHMAKIIAYYNLLIYRYYSPVWNRNGEGKLQTLKEEEEEDNDKEEEEEQDEDDDDNNNNNDDTKELNTGGLEKGEGVQIVGLKVVPKKKKKEKDEEEKEKDEKENEKEEEEEEEEEEKDDGFEDGGKKYRRRRKVKKKLNCCNDVMYFLSTGT